MTGVCPRTHPSVRPLRRYGGKARGDGGSPLVAARSVPPRLRGGDPSRGGRTLTRVHHLPAVSPPARSGRSPCARRAGRLGRLFVFDGGDLPPRRRPATLRGTGGTGGTPQAVSGRPAQVRTQRAFGHDRRTRARQVAGGGASVAPIAPDHLAGAPLPHVTHVEATVAPEWTLPQWNHRGQRPPHLNDLGGRDLPSR